VGVAPFMKPGRTAGTGSVTSRRARATSRASRRSPPRNARGRAKGGTLLTSRPPHRRRWRRELLAGGLAVAAVLAVAAFMTERARNTACTSTGDRIVSADQVTAQEGNDPSPPPGLVAQADKFASCGGSELILFRGAGQGAVQAGPAVSLRIYREPGEVENDATAREDKVQALVQRAFRTAAAIRPPGVGRDVLGLLASIASALGAGENDVWLQTLGLPTVNPANVRVLMATDPAQAVAAIARWVPSLHGAHVHLVLSPPAGNQPRFNIATDAWRRKFMIALLHQADADVISVTEVQTVESPVPGAPLAPVIPNLPESTPQLAKPRPGKLYTAKLDSSALFLPNSARFLTSQGQVLAQLQPIITGWRSGLFSHVLVVGHCAQFGPANGALLLSQQRATEVANLLRSRGVSDVTAVGVGYSQPLTPNPQDPANRVVVITAFPKSDLRGPR
jgi:outer membrane protein OmpA-like peptidoglycan-associated protein